MDWVQLYAVVLWGTVLVFTGLVARDLAVRNGETYVLPAALLVAVQVPVIGRVFNWW